MKTSTWVSVGVAVLVFAGVAVLLLQRTPSEEAAPVKSSTGPAVEPRRQDAVPANDTTAPAPAATQVPSIALPSVEPSAGPTLNPLNGKLGNVEFGMSREQVIKAFGKPDSEESGALSYLTQGFAVFAASQRGVAGFVIVGGAPGVHDFQGQTAEGVRIGSTEADIVQAYGQPASRESGGSTQTRLIYHGPKSSYRFTVDHEHGLVELSVVPPIPR